MNLFSTTLIYIGILFIAIEYVKKSNSNENTKIEYRYIPRSFAEDQLNPIPLTELYKDMFDSNFLPMTTITKGDIKKGKTNIFDDNHFKKVIDNNNNIEPVPVFTKLH